MKTAAIHCDSIRRVRSELIAPHEDGTVTIRFAGSTARTAPSRLELRGLVKEDRAIARGQEILIADRMAAAWQEREGCVR